MPATHLVLFRESGGQAPLLEWFADHPPKVKAKCMARLERLAQFGHDLRRHEADLLRDGIHELRIGFQGGHYRILYFFHGATVVVVTHGLKKERAVPPAEINLAIRRREQFVHDPAKHSMEMPND